ncbi:MAG: sensor histidine kinase [Polyangiales bacterium]
MRRRHLVALVLLLLATSLGAPAARAQAPLDVSTLTRSAPIRPHLVAYRDPPGRLTLDALRTSPPARAKLPSDDALSFGASRDTVWLAFDAANPSAQTRPFLLELAYAHLDHVTLFVVHGDGRREQRVTGDTVPFAQRDLINPVFVFRLEVAPHERVSYYLRLQTSGILKAPLTAWQPDAFYEHGQDHNLGMWVFYGVVLVLVLYNLGVYLMIRQWQYLAYVSLLIWTAGVIATLNGHMFQYFLPNHPALANRALAVFLALTVGSAARFGQHIVGLSPRLAKDVRLIAWYLPATCALALFALFAEAGVGLRASLLLVAFGIVHSMVELVRLAPAMNLQLQIYVLSWLPLILAMPVQVLRYLNLLPPSFLTDFSAQIGIAIHGITTSLVLASRVNAMQDSLRDLNAQLTDNVVELKDALARAEEASKQAQVATIAKDEFVATMSHELRTPLNAIINVPQGLLEDFAMQPTARCAACGATFLLDADEQVDPSVACAECGSVGALAVGERLHYQGDPERTTHFLRRIERSGRHLLQMVNGVLDFSKLEAGHLTLQPMQTDLGGLLREVADEIGDLAAKKQLQIALVAAEHPLPSVVDPTRVKQIVINLLANAVKFTEVAGTITVRWDALPEADVIAVQDQGIGIAPADHDRVFQRFEQVHKGDTRKYGGTGLGLPISRSLARMHGGDLTVESKPGAGSTFTLTLPRRAGRRTTTGATRIKVAG